MQRMEMALSTSLYNIVQINNADDNDEGVCVHGLGTVLIHFCAAKSQGLT